MENSSPYQTIHRATLIAFACNALLCTLKLTAGYWGKFEQETARLVSVLVLATGGGILWEAFGRPVDIHDPPAFYVLIAAGFSIALKTWLYRFEQRLASQLDSAALAADALNHKADIAATSCVFVGATAIWIGGLVEHIRELANHFPNVAGVDRIAGRKTGMRYLIDLHLEVAGDMTVQQAHQLGHQVKDWLMVELLGIADIIVHIESAGHGRG